MHFSIGVVAALAAMVTASPCPFGQMFERGELSPEDAAKFLKARQDGHPAMGAEFTTKERRIAGIDLPLGGGLVNGVLQPFTGALKNVVMPTPQATGLVKVPDAKHPYVKPKSTDVRGMCPTLNTMANHGYISHDGMTSFAELANACQITLGFGYDTCVFLAGLGLVAGGDLATGKLSIGGADSRIPNTLGPALGLSFHGPFEIDQSLARKDQYFANQANFDLDRWNRLVGIANKNGGLFNMDTLAAERALTYNESRSTNPNFDAGVTHFAVSLAQRVFVPAALSNGTKPGVADMANVSPFFLDETFPPNWFRRSTPYTLANTAADVVELYARGPTELGHNEGLNNFIAAGIDPSKFTAGEMLCFFAQTIVGAGPGQFSTEFVNNYDIVVGFFQGALMPFFADADCGTYTENAPNKAGLDTPGPDTQSPYIVNGVYQAV